MRNGRVLFAASLFSLLPPIALAQSAVLLGTSYRVSGTQIPRSELAHSFLLLSHTILYELDDEFRLDLLAKLGIEPDSRAESALRKAAEEMFHVEYGAGGPILVEEPDTGSVTQYRHLGPEGKSDGVQDSHEKAILTGQIFGQLLRELRDSNVDLAKIDRYLAQRAAKGISIVSDQPFDAQHPMHRRAEAFEEEVRRILAQP